MIRILIFILLPFAPLAAQNYVMNGSFERARVLDTKLKMDPQIFCVSTPSVF